MKVIRTSNRLQTLPPYIFAEIERMKEQCLRQGHKIIDFGIGDPNFATPEHIVKEARRQISDAKNHRYPSFNGEADLRCAVAEWYAKNYGVILDPESEVLILLGSKEGLAHLPLAFANRGDYVLIPDPGYPAYLSAALISDTQPYPMPLLECNGYKPDFHSIPDEVIENASIMFLNYPNNPTAALADERLFEEAISLARQNNFIVCHDFAYSEISFDGSKPLSFIAANGAKDVGVEFHSFSKTFAMTGWRLGYVVGDKDIIKGLGKLKSCMDSGVFKAVQLSGIRALNGPQENLSVMIEEYRLRRDLLCNGLAKLGWKFQIPQATYYLWCKIPRRFDKKSLAFAEYLIKEKSILVTPGIGFGQHGDDHVRLALNLDQEVIMEALIRMSEL